jgi:integrase/recombinase XerD
MKRNDFVDYIQLYFTKFLTLQRGMSPNTVASYSDAISLFLVFCAEKKKVRPEKLTFQRINKTMIEEFCNWLEKERKNSISTRNQRLGAIHAFFSYTMIEEPAYAALCRDILSIRMKKQPQVPPKYLSIEELKLLLNMPDRASCQGRRDIVLLTLLYDTAARVQELIDLQVGDVNFKNYPTVTLRGKGNKTRIVPIMSETTKMVEGYLKENQRNGNTSNVLFPNRAGTKLTRAGINYILDKYILKAKEKSPDLFKGVITPHTIRHSKASHLVQSNINIYYIRDFLGHVSVKTTEIYATCNPEFTRKALENASIELTRDDGYYDTNKKHELLLFLKEYR